jgi:hypothetical protein
MVPHRIPELQYAWDENFIVCEGSPGGIAEDP